MSNREASVRLPPGPHWPSPVQTLAWVRDPVRFYRYIHHRFGPIARLRLLGVGDAISISDPELIKEVFTGQRDVFHAGEANALLTPLLGPSSLLVLDGAQHLRHRRMMLPPFHGQAVRAYEARIAAITRSQLKRWPTGREVDSRRLMQALTLEVILQVVMGVSDPERLERLRTLLPRLTNISSAEIALYWLFPSLRARALSDQSFLRRVGALRFRAEADRLLYEEIAAHRARDDAEDILALLISARDELDSGLTDRELRDELMTLLAAGHETTTTALAWCLERLVRHPAVLDRLVNELARGEDSDAYLDAVITETLRVRPVIEGVWRRVKAPTTIGGYTVPAGTLAMPLIAEVQTAADAFEEPRAFKPERFLNGHKAPPYTLIPFGGGPRRCIGASFAMLEMRTILRTLLEHLSVAPPSSLKPEPARVHHITLVPAHGGLVRLQPRDLARSHGA